MVSLSPSVTIAHVLLAAAVLAAVLPLRDVVSDALDYESLEEFFFSPAMVVALVEAAAVAPIVEELVKPVGVFVMARADLLGL